MHELESTWKPVVAWAILAYLSIHPYAKDTAVGISRWWLAREGVEADWETVAQTAEQLLAWGWLTTLHLSTAPRVYALNHARRNLLQSLLQNPLFTSEAGQDQDPGSAATV